MPLASDFRLWTFTIKGPHPIGVELLGNPPIEHNGGTSVAHQVLTSAEAENLKTTLQAMGNEVESWTGEGQTAEQLAERQAYLQEDRVWPCAVCPACPWADHLNGPCGLETWPAESVEVLRSTSPVHGEAERVCPVRDS